MIVRGHKKLCVGSLKSICKAMGFSLSQAMWSEGGQ
jgi:hypothetical protein